VARYYWISTFIILGLTLAIAAATKKKNSREVMILFIKVTMGVVAFIAAIAGVAQLLKISGIAEESFVL
tara:strand:- start:2175 stop:2381 length:207 start_codon:yes stop_codon:yes gene_type:complete